MKTHKVLILRWFNKKEEHEKIFPISFGDSYDLMKIDAAIYMDSNIDLAQYQVEMYEGEMKGQTISNRKLRNMVVIRQGNKGSYYAIVETAPVQKTTV